MAEPNDNPPLRSRQSQRVRDELRAAFIDLILQHGVRGFSLHDVAEAAGVSDRTLYRYYPSREALIDEVQRHTFDAVEKAKRERGVGGEQPADWSSLAFIAGTFEAFEEHAELVRASALIREAGLIDDRHDERTSDLRADMATVGIDPEALPAFSVLIRLLTSSDGWSRMTSTEFGLGSREAGLAAQWAAQVLTEAAQAHVGPLRPTLVDPDDA